MEEITLQNKNGKILASSRDVAEKFGKLNKHVNEAIKKLIAANPDMKEHFIASEYKSSRGRYEKEFLLDEVGWNILIYKFGFSAMNPRFEIKFKTVLQELFPGLKIIHQYFIYGYKLDFFIPDLNMIIEYDEEYHKYILERDSNRINIVLKNLQNMINNNMPLYDQDKYMRRYLLKNSNILSVVRVQKGNEIKGIKDICTEIEKCSNFSCTYFMNPS